MPCPSISWSSGKFADNPSEIASSHPTARQCRVVTCRRRARSQPAVAAQGRRPSHICREGHRSCTYRRHFDDERSMVAVAFSRIPTRRMSILDPTNGRAPMSLRLVSFRRHHMSSPQTANGTRTRNLSPQFETPSKSFCAWRDWDYANSSTECFPKLARVWTASLPPAQASIIIRPSRLS